MLTGLAWRPNRQEFATAMRDGTVRLWSLHQDLRGAIEEGTYTTMTSPSDTKGTYGLRTVAFSPDGSWLAAAGHGPTIYVWRTEEAGPPLHILNGQAETINTVGFGRDHSTLWSAGSDGMIHFYDLRQGTKVRTIKTQGLILNAAVSSDRRYIAATSIPKQEATLYDFETGEEVRRLSIPPQDFVWALAFSPDNRVLATGIRGDQGRVRLFHLDQGTQIGTAVVPRGDDWVFSLAFSRSGKFLLAGVYNDALYLLDGETGAILKRYGGGTCAVKK